MQKNKLRDKYFLEHLKQAVNNTGLSEIKLAEKINDLIRNNPELAKKQRLKPSCTHRNISSWLLGAKYPKRYMPFLCQALGIEEADLYPSTLGDKWESDEEYVTEVIAKGEMYKYINRIGLDFHFLQGLERIVDFNTEFPLWTAIMPSTDIHSLEPYILLPETKWSDSAPMEGIWGVFQVKHKDEKGDTHYKDLSHADFLFLKDVQTQVQLFVKSLFACRKQEMIEELKRVNDSCIAPIEGGRSSRFPAKTEEFDKCKYYKQLKKEGVIDYVYYGNE